MDDELSTNLTPTTEDLVKSFKSLVINCSGDPYILEQFSQILEEQIEKQPTRSSSKLEMSGSQSDLFPHNSTEYDTADSDTEKTSKTLKSSLHGLIDFEPEFISSSYISKAEVDLKRIFEEYSGKYTWVAPDNITYSFGNQTLFPNQMEWYPEIKNLMQKLNADLELELNSCLITRYRDGRDKLSLHQDNEFIFDHDTPMCNISVGAVRDIQFWDNGKEESGNLIHRFSLTEGSLLIMRPGTQKKLWHKVLNGEGPRYCLSFRKVLTPEFPTLKHSTPKPLFDECSPAPPDPCFNATPHVPRKLSLHPSSTPATAPPSYPPSHSRTSTPCATPGHVLRRNLPTPPRPTPRRTPPPRPARPAPHPTPPPRPARPFPPYQQSCATQPVSQAPHLPESPSSILIPERPPTGHPAPPTPPPGSSGFIPIPKIPLPPLPNLRNGFPVHDSRIINDEQYDHVIIGDSLVKGLNVRYNTHICKGGIHPKHVLPLLSSCYDTLPREQYNDIKTVTLIVGTNALNINGYSNKGTPFFEVISDYISLIRELKKLFPNARMALFNVIPRASTNRKTPQRIIDFNIMLSQYVTEIIPNVVWIRLFREFLDFEGNLRRDLYGRDGVHLNPKGKKMMAQTISYFQQTIV